MAVKVNAADFDAASRSGVTTELEMILADRVGGVGEKPVWKARVIVETEVREDEAAVDAAVRGLRSALQDLEGDDLSA